MATYVKGDPYWLTVRYGGQCAGCSADIKAGDRSFYWPRQKRLECVKCGDTSERRFIAEVQDEITSGGW